jgi:hypothetical protein
VPFVNLPFSQEQFFAVFAAYNDSVFPAQLVLLVLGLGAALVALRPRWRADRAIGAVMALLWLWMGVVYHWGFFSSVNPAARAFGAGFVVEAGLLLWFLVIRRRVSFRAAPSWRGGVGLVLLVYAFAIYPAIGTLGLLLWATNRPPAAIMAIPWLWAVVGTLAAFRLGIREDIGLLVALVFSVWGWLAGYRVQSPAAA